jgi:hypothetical protein
VSYTIADRLITSSLFVNSLFIHNGNSILKPEKAHLPTAPHTLSACLDASRAQRRRGSHVDERSLNKARIQQCPAHNNLIVSINLLRQYIFINWDASP